MRIRTQPLFDNYNKFGYIEPTYIAIARPGKRLLGILNGVDESSCRLDINLNNTAVLTFDVNRIVDGEVSSYYNRIEQLMELELPGVGWFKINEEPTISGDGNTEVMSVRAESLEIELAQYYIKGMEINMGTLSSAEMLATDNVYNALDGTDSKFAWTNVKFYRDTTQLQQLINIASDSWTDRDIINRLDDYPCLYNSWRITYNLGSVNKAINDCAAAITDEERSKVLASYEGRIKSQQSIYFLTQSYPELLSYLEVAGVDLSKPPILDEDGNPTDEDPGNYTVKEMLEVELQREKELSLLDLILDETDWTVGFVDNSVVSDSDEEDDTIPLKDKVGSFEVQSSNIYNFLMQEASPYFRCIFVYDTINKQVNAYNVNNLGVDTNVFINFSNIQNSVERTNDDQIKTVFHVAGGEDLDIAYANLGGDSIVDLSYYMNTDHFDQATIDKYNNWVTQREVLRKQFMDLSVQYYDKLEDIEYIEDRVPLDGADPSQYKSFSEEELIEERAKYEAILAGIKSYYVDENNDFSISALMDSQDDYAEYLYITNVILSSPLNAYDTVYYDPVTGEYEITDSSGHLGQIDTILLNRKIANGGFVDDSDSVETRQNKTDYKRQKEYLDNYQYDFETFGISYGLNELKVRIDDLQNKITTLWSRGYSVDVEDDEEQGEEETQKYDDEYHRKKYELYEKYKSSLEQAKAVLDERQEESITARGELKSISNQMTELTKQAEMSNPIYGFTNEELELMKEYFVHTDYVNENLIITNISTSQEIVDTENQLYKYAQEELYAAAHPQWRWTTSQNNLFLMPEFKSWHSQLDIGNYITIGMEPVPSSGYDRNNINYQTKLRVVSIGLNPFMIEPDIDITFSSIIQYKSKQNDFVDLFELNTGVGDSQISAYSNGKHLDGSYSIDSSFLVKLLQGGMKTYIENSSAETTMESYQNIVGPVRYANDWILNTGASGAEAIRVWTTEGDGADDAIMSGGNIVTTSIFAKHLAVNQIISANYVPETDSHFSASGSYWNLQNGDYVSPGFAIINTNNGTEDNPDWDSSAYFRGEITAEEGEIAGWQITSDKIYKEISANDSVVGEQQYVHICSNFYSSENTVPYNPVFYVQFEGDDKFYVRSNGELFAKNANISGEIHAGSGSIGGWTIGSDRMTNTCENGNKVIFANGDNSSKDVFVIETDNGTAWPFWIHNDGEVHAENANITGSITATSLNVTNATITGTISGDNINGGTISGTSFTQTHNYQGAQIGEIGLYNCTASISGGIVSTTVLDCNTITNGGYSANVITCHSGLTVTGNFSLTGNVDGSLTATGNLTAYGNVLSSGSVSASGNVSCQRIYVDHLKSGSQAESGLTACGAGGAQGQIHLMGSSSIRYKNINRVITNDDIEKLYNIPVYEFTYKDGYLVDNDERNGIAMPGFIAEDWDSVMPITVNHLDDGRPEMWNSNIVVPLMFQMIKNEHERNDKLQAEVDKLQSEVNELKQLFKQLTER